MRTARLPLPTNAVAWWRAENNADDEGGVYNGTPGSAPLYTAGHTGNAFNFNNDANNRVSLPTINVGSTYSITLWFKPGGSGAGNMEILVNDSTSATKFGGIFWDTSNLRLVYGTNSGNIVVSDNGSVPAGGRAIKITLIYSSSKCKLYIQDLLVATEASTHSETYNNPATVGNNVAGSSGHPLIGWVDEIILYNAALTPQAGLAAWYKGDGDATDSSGWGWDGALGVGTAFDTDRVGAANKAFKFNGASNSAVTLPKLPLGTAYTYDFWVYFDSVAVSFKDVIGGNWNGGTLLGELYINSSKLEYWAGGSKRVQGAATMVVNTWTHIKMTYSQVDSKSRLYVNGVLDATESGTHTEVVTNSPNLGFGTGSGAAAFSGRLDDVQAYDSVV